MPVSLTKSFHSRARFFRNSLRLLLSISTLVLTGCATPHKEVALDCPLRDRPFSVDSPLLDVMLSPEAMAMVNAEQPNLMKGLPENMLKTTAPTMTAIMSVRSIASMRRVPKEQIEALNQKLGQLPVTDQDRQARCARYDNDVPEFALPKADVNVLVFHKINGFDHGPSVTAATDAIKAMGIKQGWAVAVTDKGGAFNAKTLASFDVVVWNNVSGDVLTLSQRTAFQQYINQGGGFAAIHGSGGDIIAFWDWYIDELLGARFIGHPMEPQFQDALLKIEASPSGIGKALTPGWTLNDEWYSFTESARLNGADVVATLDESTYKPEGMFGQNLRMGDDHPIVWTRCVGKGRSFYSAIGHRPEVYADAKNLQLLEHGILWAAGHGADNCAAATSQQ